MRPALWIYLASVVAAHAQPAGPAPVINPGGVVSSASYQAGHSWRTTAGVLSGGSLITIFGQNLSVGTSTATSLPLPFTLGGTSVFFEQPYEPLLPVLRFRVPLLYVSPTQINAQVPTTYPSNATGSFWPPGPDGYAGGYFVVQVGTQESAGEPNYLHDSVPAVFTVPNTTGQLAYLVSARDGATISLSRGAQPGEPMTLYLTGLGPARGGTPGVFQPTNSGGIRVPDGEPTPYPGPVVGPVFSVWTQPTVTIGGRPAVVLFAGLTSGFVGLDQINFVIPPDAPLGCTVPIVITGDDYSSNPATLSISANAGPCQ